MKNYTLLMDKIQQGLAYLQQQEEKLNPLINALTDEITKRVKRHEVEDLSFKEVLEIYSKLMEQQTNSILIVTKMQEVLKYSQR